MNDIKKKARKKERKKERKKLRNIGRVESSIKMWTKIMKEVKRKRNRKDWKVGRMKVKEIWRKKGWRFNSKIKDFWWRRLMMKKGQRKKWRIYKQTKMKHMFKKENEKCKRA